MSYWHLEFIIKFQGMYKLEVTFSYIGYTLRILLFFLSQGFSCTPTMCHHYGCPCAAASASQGTGCLLGCLQEPPCTWLCSLDGSCLLFADGNINAACTGSRCCLSTCLPSPRTEVYIPFSAALEFCACGSPLYIHMAIKAYRYTSFVSF